MKLRFQHNSIRLRLKRGEVDRLVKTGRVEETIVFAHDPAQVLTYILETVDGALTPHTVWDGRTVRVRISASAARRWADSDEVAIEERQPVSPDIGLHLLVEKDFACLDRDDGENEDTFPHPLAGKT